MEVDEEKIDDAVLALLYLTSFDDAGVMRAWKGMDWGVLDRLCEKGFIGNPRGKAKSVAFTPEGFARSRRLFEDMFRSE